jgi:branched-chain amino acid transport system substrate-binding protein
MGAQKRRTIGFIGVVLAVSILSLIPRIAAGETKTLKIGAVIQDTWPGGVDFKKYLDVVVPLFNDSGGLTIDGEHYNIEMIRYDTKGNAEIGRAAVERLIDRDKVKFILGDETIDAWLPLTEANKVIVVAQTPAPSIYNPKWKYAFEGCGMQTQAPAVWGWFIETFPNMKTVSIVFPDNGIGHGEHGKVVNLAANFGQKVLVDMYYPPDTNDFSSVAAKIKKSDSTFFVTGGDGTQRGTLLYKALYEAGYKGQILAYLGIRAVSWSKIIPLTMIEGLIGGTPEPFEIEPLPAQTKRFKDAYVAKYGTWDNPTAFYWLEWDELINALKKANSLDPDKIAAVLSSGMQFDSVIGRSRMVSRPDFKNSRSVSLINSLYMLKISSGKAELVHRISLDDVYRFDKKFFNW